MTTFPTTAVPPPPRPAPLRSRPAQFALFLAAISWYECARVLAQSAARGLALRFYLLDLQPLLEALLLLFLIVLGFALLRAIESRKAPLRIALGLPSRASARTEWLTGAALGWAIAVACILPMAIGRALDVQLWTAPRAFELFALSLLTLAVATLAHALALYGYGFQRLIAAVGPARATILFCMAAALASAFKVTVNSYVPLSQLPVSVLITMLGSLLLALCWLRTHGLWLVWGLHFAWAAATGVLFGLQLGDRNLSSVIDTRPIGPLWLTGGSFGPAAATLSLLVVIAAIVAVVRLTSDWAYAYTHPPLIPAGYDVTIAPPAAHIAIEQSATQSQPVNPASLIQILPAAPPPPE